MKAKYISTFPLVSLLVSTLIVSQVCRAQVVGQGLDASPKIPQTTPTQETPDLQDDQTDDVKAILDSLTLDQKIMQLMFVRLSGVLAPSSVDSKLLEMLTPGGIILPEIGSASSTIEYVELVRKFEAANPGSIPFFIAGNAFAPTDSEVKNSNRFLNMPSMLSLSASGENEDAKELFHTVADNFHRMGLNTHFGPSLTLASDLNNSLGSLYTFGDDPATTANAAGSLLTAFYTNDILWMPSGFPGGEANRTGNGPAIMLTPGPHFIERDGLPYFIAIKHGVPIIHVANTLAPTIDPDMKPASVSRKVITSLLKGTLDYKGLVISGPMDGPYILTKYEPEAAAVQSIVAGSDMLLWSKTSPQIPKAIALISNAVRNGNIDEALIDNAVLRILTLKSKFGLFDRPLPEVRQALKMQNENEKLGVAQRIEKRAATLLKNDANLLPLKKDLSTPLFITGIVDLQPLKKILAKELKYVNHFEIKTAKHTGRVEDFELRRLERTAKGVRTALCIFDNRIDARSQAQVIAELKKKNLKVIVVLLGYPRDINTYQSADALLLLYGATTSLNATISALSDILLGNAPVTVLSDSKPLTRPTNQTITFDVLDVIQSPTGRLPVSLEPFFPAGHSVSYAPTSIKSVHWDFGDNARSNENRAEHIYTQPGQYTATLTIEVSDGTTASGTFAIDIQ
ncbi:MAG TPA: PKD domain-containing protein [Candidatus Hydrogenedentes bacterium]|nr:PKD domain-containing protein [Candidatus Hydrogenedentota bacterium]